MDPAAIYHGFNDLIRRAEARGQLNFWTHACLRQMTSSWRPNSRWLQASAASEAEGKELLDSLNSARSNINRLERAQLSVLLRILPKQILLGQLPEYPGLQLCADAYDRRGVLRIEHKLLADLVEGHLRIDELDVRDADTLLSLIPEARSEGILDEAVVARYMALRRQAKRRALGQAEATTPINQAILFAERAVAASSP